MRVSLFVTCLVDQVWPSAGVATVRLLRRLGCDVSFDARQTCCGQPAFNAGHHDEARRVARRFVEIYGADTAPVVMPSGSCAAMARHMGGLLHDDAALAGRAEAIGKRTYELSEFLVRVLGVEDAGGSFAGRLTWHDACHARRELGLKDEPRRLLQHLRGAELVEVENAEACCGFGGTFSVTHAEVSLAILDEKVDAIERAGVDVVGASDVSCLMQIGGRLSRRDSRVRALHLAELLAGEPR